MPIQTLTIPKGEVLSINSELSIPVGVEMDIVNESTLYNVYLTDTTTQPNADKSDKRSLTQNDWSRPEGYIPAGSLEVWAYSPDGVVVLSVQVL